MSSSPPPDSEQDKGGPSAPRSDKEREPGRKRAREPDPRQGKPLAILCFFKDENTVSAHLTVILQIC